MTSTEAGDNHAFIKCSAFKNKYIGNPRPCVAGVLLVLAGLFFFPSLIFMGAWAWVVMAMESYDHGYIGFGLLLVCTSAGFTLDPIAGGALLIIKSDMSLKR